MAKGKDSWLSMAKKAVATAKEHGITPQNANNVSPSIINGMLKKFGWDNTRMGKLKDFSKGALETAQKAKEATFGLVDPVKIITGIDIDKIDIDEAERTVKSLVGIKDDSHSVVEVSPITYPSYDRRSTQFQSVHNPASKATSSDIKDLSGLPD